MSKINDGGPAFPACNEANVNDTMGMSLRDWFAGQADVPWNAVIETLAMKGVKVPTLGQMAEYRAKMKFVEADAMIAERAKAEGGAS